jgi:ApbE superfamily uncharacterized protein (UPF0280 family)
MGGGAQISLLPDGRRLHLNHGPIDLIVEAFGARTEIESAYRQAAAVFPEILPRLVEELACLRRAPRPGDRDLFAGPVARRMAAAVIPHADAAFVTPMAAVAGAVADEVLAALCAGRELSRAYVNNGGDIAFHLTPGASLTAGLIGDYFAPQIDGTCRLGFEMPARGIATSGWKGRSFSLGIADAVTVLAPDAAAADVAATLIANAVNADHPAVRRAPADGIDLDSDLGDRLVTVSVGRLDAATVKAALDSGVACAEDMAAAGHIMAAVLVLQGQYRAAGKAPEALISSARAA